MPIEVGSKFKLTSRQDPYRVTRPFIDPESARVASSRAKTKLRRLILGNMFHDTRFSLKFLTLTFSDEVTDLTVANYELQKFRQSMARRIKEKVNYIGVPEIQEKRLEKTGKAVWHYHLLTFNMPYMKSDDIASVWKNGFVKPKRVNRVVGATNYLTKYLSKSYSDQRLKNRKRYYNAVQCQIDRFTDEEQIFREYDEFRPKATKVNEYPLYSYFKDGSSTECGKKCEYFVLPPSFRNSGVTIPSLSQMYDS